MLRIGLISDTHGLLRPQAIEALRGCGQLIHAGDIGSAQILAALRALAPLAAVRGNNDRAAWAAEIPESVQIEADGVRVFVLHDRKELAFDPRVRNVDIVISGHSHRPRVERHDGVLYVNPGSAGARRFALPVTVAELLVDAGTAQARIVELAP